MCVTDDTHASLVFLQRAIANAKTLEEVERLNKLLQSGQVPGAGAATNGQNGLGNCQRYVTITSYRSLKNVVFTVKVIGKNTKRLFHRISTSQ